MSAVEIVRRHAPAAVQRILESLPEWFGIPEAVAAYVGASSQQDSFVAVLRDEVVGVVLVKRHFPESAEVTLIAVHAEERGKGVGKKLVAGVAEALASEGCSLLQVHTVGTSYDNEAYAQTRAFYRRVGFLPLQEFDGIDWDGPSLVLVKTITV